MTARESVMFFVSKARENAKAARKLRRQECLVIANWHEGRADAFLHAARMIRGGLSSKTKNNLGKVAV